MSVSIKTSQISSPQVEISTNAASQIRLSKEHDPYHKNKEFRVHISGKGCDGFTYQTLFDFKKQDDVEINVLIYNIKVIMSPFTAYYCQNIKIDFIQDFELDTEGFEVINLDQENFTGKFWRKNPELTPILNDD